MIRVRPARESDINPMALLWTVLIQEHQDLEPTLYATEPHAMGTYLGFLRRQRTDRRSMVLVVDDDKGGLAGYLVGGVGRRSPVYTVKNVGMIFDLVVAPDKRRKGIGRALVDAAMGRFGAAGVHYVQVNYAPDNPTSAKFWPKLGFETLLREAYCRVD